MNKKKQKYSMGNDLFIFRPCNWAPLRFLYQKRTLRNMVKVNGELLHRSVVVVVLVGNHIHLGR